MVLFVFGRETPEAELVACWPPVAVVVATGRVVVFTALRGGIFMLQGLAAAAGAPTAAGLAGSAADLAAGAFRSGVLTGTGGTEDCPACLGAAAWVMGVGCCEKEGDCESGAADCGGGAAVLLEVAAGTAATVC